MVVTIKGEAAAAAACCVCASCAWWVERSFRCRWTWISSSSPPTSSRRHRPPSVAVVWSTSNLTSSAGSLSETHTWNTRSADSSHDTYIHTCTFITRQNSRRQSPESEARAVATPGSSARRSQNCVILFCRTQNDAKWYTDHGSCSRDWTTTAAVAEYIYVWRGNRTKSLSDFVQL